MNTAEVAARCLAFAVPAGFGVLVTLIGLTRVPDDEVLAVGLFVAGGGYVVLALLTVGARGDAQENRLRKRVRGWLAHLLVLWPLWPLWWFLVNFLRWVIQRRFLGQLFLPGERLLRFAKYDSDSCGWGASTHALYIGSSSWTFQRVPYARVEDIGAEVHANDVLIDLNLRVVGRPGAADVSGTFDKTSGTRLLRVVRGHIAAEARSPVNE